MIYRKDFLPFAKPDLGQDEIDLVSEVIRSGWLTTGDKTKEFEKRFADYVGAKYAVAVNSATAAMHLALSAIDLQRGDEVIVPTMTFAATAEVVRYFDAKPVLVDMEHDTFNIDISAIENAINKNTKAIIPVHVAGQAVNLDQIHEIAQRHQLVVIEDAAHALPTRYKDKMIGSISDFTSFSFYVTKTLATGEGGMITTDNEEWAEHCRIMSLHGISKNAWSRYTSTGSWYYEIIAPGFKYNMTDIAGALGLVQLKKIDRMFERRLHIANRYIEDLRDHWAFELPQVKEYSSHSYHLFILRLNLDKLTIDRSQFIEQLRAANIGTSVHWIPLHMHPYYVATYGYQATDYPIAYREYWRMISLPIYPTMTDEDVEYVLEVLKDIAEHNQR